MGYVRPTQNPIAPGQNTGRQFAPSDAFVNFYLPTGKGGRKKFTAEGLNANIPQDKALMDSMARDEAAVIQWIKDNLIIEYNLLDHEDNVFDLPV